MGNIGIATMIGVHMHPTVGSGTCNTLVSNSNTPATNAVSWLGDDGARKLVGVC
jgi:hypothetical protein